VQRIWHTPGAASFIGLPVVRQETFLFTTFPSREDLMAPSAGRMHVRAYQASDALEERTEHRCVGVLCRF
jgi:hypothetical protein